MLQPGLVTVETSDIKAVYKAVGKEHLFEYEMRDAAIAAERWRATVDGKYRPGGIGEPFVTLPGTVVSHYKIANEKLYHEDPNAFWCWLWHRFPEHRCRTGVCPDCGRS